MEGVNLHLTDFQDLHALSCLCALTATYSPQRTVYADPKSWHETVAPFRRDSAVIQLTGTGIEPAWAVLRREALLEVERQSEQFTNAPACSVSQARAVKNPEYQAGPMRTLVEMDGAEHQAHRLVVNKWFLPGSIRRLDEAITARAEEANRDHGRPWRRM